MNILKHYKMFKKGKNWCFMAIATVTVAFGALNVSMQANADTNSVANEPVATAVQSQSTATSASAVNSDTAVASSAVVASVNNSAVSTNVDSASTNVAPVSASNTPAQVSAEPASVAQSAAPRVEAKLQVATQPAQSSSNATANYHQQVQATSTATYATQTNNNQQQSVDLNSLHFTNNPAQQQFIQSVAPGAINGWNQYHVLPSVTVAQAIVESGWGTSGLASQYHNLFGIKGAYNGQSVNLQTHEVYSGNNVMIYDNFRVYPNNSASIEDHGRFLNVNSRYRNLLSVTDPVAVTNMLQQDGYATDPNYAWTLQSIIRSNNLTQLDSVAFSGHVVVNKPQNDNSSSNYGNNTNYYIVQSGDTLSSIANQFSTTVNTLAHLNNIQNVNRIYVGQHLLVRQATTNQSQPAQQQPVTPSQSSNASANINTNVNVNNGQSSYTVKSGDTLSGIASQFGTNYVQLAQINHLSNPNRIYVGQVLQLQANNSSTSVSQPVTPVQHNTATPTSTSTTSSYTVKSGDTLSGIASQFGVPYEQLAQINGIANPNRIYVGQVIRVNGAAPQTTSSTNYTSSYRNATTRGDYTVKSGDTLSGIAAQYGLNWYSLAQKNGLAAPYTIYIGQQLAL